MTGICPKVIFRDILIIGAFFRLSEGHNLAKYWPNILLCEPSISSKPKTSQGLGFCPHKAVCTKKVVKNGPHRNICTHIESKNIKVFELDGG